MDWGNIAFNTPRTIPLRKPRKIHLVIHPSLSAEDLTERIKKAGPVETDRIKISNIMQAKLIGSSFTITPITPETQPVSKTHATEWKWEVAPQKPGIQSLYLTINAMVTVGQNERPRPIKTFDREIQVQVTGMQQATLFLIKNWVWVVAGLLVTAAATFFFTRTLRRRSLTSRVARAPLSAADEPVDIFISYSSKDRNEVLPMVERLRQEGLKVWIDQGGIDGALLWGQEIVDAITRCRVVLVMGSSSSFSSPNVVKEICLASEQQKPILPVHLEPVEVPKSISYPLAGIQHIEIFRGDREQNMGAILRSLHRLGVRGDSQEGEDVQNGDAS
jgi:hypothetical protein